MNGIVLRWGVPALLTVVGGTSLAISSTSATMTQDLGARATAALTNEAFGWASVSFDARDAILTGTATNQQMIDEAVAQVAAIHGVRSVRSDVILAEYVSPFPFAASVKDGAITLTGGVPDETAHAQLLLETGAADDQLRLLSGAPRRADWRAAVAYGLRYLEQFDEGGFTLADLEITINGRAKSAESYDALMNFERESAPAGLTVAQREIVPPLASPFEWHATFNGTSLAVSGYTPSEDFAERLQTSGIGGRPVATSLVLASGAPAGFEATAARLLENLVLLEEGRADISDGTASLSGAPADAATAEKVRLAMAPLGVDVALEPPRVDAYEFIATRSGGATTLSGYAPDAATRDRLEAIEGVDAARLGLARGAPERFDSAVEFGLGLLGHLSEGRFVIRNTSLSIEGRAASAADFAAVETTLELGAPQGLILRSADVLPPLANPFVWSAEKRADGRVRLAGFVPSRTTGSKLRAAVSALTEDKSAIADGEPKGFEPEAVAALGVLELLQTGKIDYDGRVWSMTGTVGTPEEAFTAEQAFAKAGLRDAGWSLSLQLPKAAAPVALPVIDPYVWRAQKDSGGRITLGGFVPTEGLRKVLLGRAGEGAVDNTNLGAGYPDGFIPGALAAVDALAALGEGTVAFDGRSWSIAGQVATTDARLAVEGALMAAVDTSGWTIAIQAQDAAPVVTPYAWSATKAADGRVSLSGHVPSAELKDFIAVRADNVARDTTELASGEPAGFAAYVLAGLEALNHLSTGTVKYEDGAWTIAGVPQTQADADLAVAALSETTTGGAGWQQQIAEPRLRLEPKPEPTVEPEIPAEPEPVPEQVPEPAAGEPAQAPEAAPAETPAEPAAEPALPEEPAVAATPEAVPVARNYAFAARKALGGAIELSGAVPADAARRFFGVIAGGVPTEGLTIASTLPDDFIPNADAGIRALVTLDAGEFGLDGGTWVLSGRVETKAERQAALDALAAIPVASGWQADISLLPPLDVCRQHVAAFAARNAILFRSGSAELAEESFPAIDELAGYLGECPEATVNVEGHTDADGDDALNLALSVARAETVVDALIERGVSYQRLYAVGYGESLPIADNDTTAGKRANRRIAFTIEDGHE